MDVENFFEYATHLENFDQEQLIELLDFDEIETLADIPSEQVAVEALGQYLVGNRYDPTNTFKSLENLMDKRNFIDTWFSVIKDPQTLKVMGKFVAHKLM